jgi:polyferredoxin
MRRNGRAAWRACRREADITFLTRLLFAAYFIEAGLVLVVAPWTVLWQRNFFAEAVPLLDQLVANPFVRGGVSGIGVITALAGFAELAGVFRPARRSESAPERNAEA